MVRAIGISGTQALMAAILVMAMLVASPVAAPGQSSPLSFEGRSELVIPIGEFDEEGLDTGFAFGLVGIVDVAPYVALRFGYSSARFDYEDAFTVTDAGFFAGPVLRLPGSDRVAFLLLGDVVFNTLTMKGSEQSLAISVESDRAIGFGVGGGLEIAVTPRTFLTPAIRYQKYEAEFDLGEEFSGNVTTLAVGLSGRFQF